MLQAQERVADACCNVASIWDLSAGLVRPERQLASAWKGASGSQLPASRDAVSHAGASSHAPFAIASST